MRSPVAVVMRAATEKSPTKGRRSARKALTASATAALNITSAATCHAALNQLLRWITWTRLSFSIRQMGLGGF